MKLKFKFLLLMLTGAAFLGTYQSVNSTPDLQETIQPDQDSVILESQDVLSDQICDSEVSESDEMTDSETIASAEDPSMETTDEEVVPEVMTDAEESKTTELQEGC